jgi:hypothetical protein
MARTHWAARRASAPSDTHDAPALGGWARASFVPAGLGTVEGAIVDDAGFLFAEASCEYARTESRFPPFWWPAPPVPATRRRRAEGGGA